MWQKRLMAFLLQVYQLYFKLKAEKGFQPEVRLMLLNTPLQGRAF